MYTFDLDRNSGEELGLYLKSVSNDKKSRSRFWKTILSKYNIYDIRTLFNLYYIIKEDTEVNVSKESKVAVIVNLFYDDQVEECFQYLNRIPIYIDLYIISSKEEILRRVKELFHSNSDRNNLECIVKNNRGRDISALLVAGRTYALQYDYICFVHDKKSMQYNETAWSKSFFYNIWENTLKSTSYINGIIKTFQDNDELGVLAIPEPIHGCYFSYLGREWGGDYANTVELCKKLDISCILDKDKAPITLGTAFWCRTEAIRDVLEYNFGYEDFPEEPMPRDGTVSHAIERIWGYAAQNRGYYTGTVMNSEYASLRISTLQELMIQAISFIRQNNKCEMPSDIINRNMKDMMIREFIENYDEIYIYGAGKIGKMCANYMELHSIKFSGFVVSDEEIDKNSDSNVYCVSEILKRPKAGIIIALGQKNKDIIKAKLDAINYKSYFVF